MSKYCYNLPLPGENNHRFPHYSIFCLNKLLYTKNGPSWASSLADGARKKRGILRDYERIPFMVLCRM